MSLKSPPTSLMYDFTSDKGGMLSRDGEDPEYAVIAIAPEHSEVVKTALDQLETALRKKLEPKDIVILEQDAIEMASGEIIELDDMSLFYSLTFPTANSRVYSLTLGAPSSATIH